MRSNQYLYNLYIRLDSALLSKLIIIICDGIWAGLALGTYDSTWQVTNNFAVRYRKREFFYILEPLATCWR